MLIGSGLHSMETWKWLVCSIRWFPSGGGLPPLASPPCTVHCVTVCCAVAVPPVPYGMLVRGPAHITDPLLGITLLYTANDEKCETSRRVCVEKFDPILSYPITKMGRPRKKNPRSTSHPPCDVAVIRGHHRSLDRMPFPRKIRIQSRFWAGRASISSRPFSLPGSCVSVATTSSRGGLDCDPSTHTTCLMRAAPASLALRWSQEEADGSAHLLDHGTETQSGRCRAWARGGRTGGNSKL